MGRWRDPSATVKCDWLVCYWQLVIWIRQVLLLLISQTGAEIINQIDPVTHPADFALAQSVQIGLIFIVTLISWRLHHTFQPYALRYQNTLESWLFGSTTVLLSFATLYSFLPSDPPAIRIALDMPLDERKRRYEKMIATVRDDNVQNWTRDFLRDLSEA